MNNPPAFPVVPPLAYHKEQIESGMTLRDYFAAAAMQGIASNPTMMKHAIDFRGKQDVTKFLAEHGYDIADAMLKAREQ